MHLSNDLNHRLEEEFVNRRQDYNLTRLKTATVHPSVAEIMCKRCTERKWQRRWLVWGDRNSRKLKVLTKKHQADWILHIIFTPWLKVSNLYPLCPLTVKESFYADSPPSATSISTQATSQPDSRGDSSIRRPVLLLVPRNIIYYIWSGYTFIFSTNPAQPTNKNNTTRSRV